MIRGITRDEGGNDRERLRHSQRTVDMGLSAKPLSWKGTLRQRVTLYVLYQQD